MRRGRRHPRRRRDALGTQRSCAAWQTTRDRRRGRPHQAEAAGANGPGLKSRARYDEELVALRDEIGEARLEDVPQLVAQMERLQQVSLTRADLQTILVDPASPYFGHLRLREQVRGRGLVERDVLIGRATFVDPQKPHQHRRLATRAYKPALLPLR